MLFSFRLVIFILYCSAFCIDSIWTIPILNERQDATTVTTVQVINTVEGPMTQTCVITLTPITDGSGKPAVQEVEDCKLTPGTQASVPPSTPPAPAPSSPSPTPSPSSPSPTPSSASPSPPVSTATPSSSTSSSTSTATPSPVANTSSNVPTSVTPSPAKGTGTSTATPNASEASSSSPTSKFQIPGKNLSVLPIGLGVFAGIVVIALIVVGLVTYERTKYRKAFRQRRLAEQGATMGYGGQV